jgi:AAA15 family ATPase/GTPase
MIKSISIENYKGFESFKCENLSLVNLFGGSNNVGKTSILEAIFTFYDRFSPEFLLKPYAWRGLIPPLRAGSEQEFWLPIFYVRDFDKIIRINIEYYDKSFDELTLSIVKDYHRPISTKEMSILPESTDRGTSASSQFALHLEGHSNSELTLDSFFFFADKQLQSRRKVALIPNFSPIARFLSTKTYNSREDSLRYGELMKRNEEHLVLEALKIIDDRITRINPIPSAEDITILYGGLGPTLQLPINYLGDGVLRLLSYVLAILNTPNGFIMIDEVENGFHYTKHEDVWKLLFELAEKYNVQIFTNTHSFEMIRAFNNSCLNMDKDYFYFELFRQPNHNIILTNHLDKTTLNYKIENNKSIRGE